MESLKGSIVFITGASSGIGRATARAFAEQGARLLLCARRLDRLTEVVGELAQSEADPDVFSFQLDVRDPLAVVETLANLPPEWKAIDVLVNNAGLSRGSTPLYDNLPGDWDEMIDTNVKGLLYVTRQIVPGMIERGRGHVISMGSTAGHQTYSGGAVYCATKAAEKAIMEGLRIDLIGKPVRATSIDPGMVETEFAAVRFRDEDKGKQLYQNITPLQPEDVADAIVYAATRPKHVNIHSILMTTIDQANTTVFHRHSQS
jgi:3-hydroxy acid dehydrogenase/malonic semialdehyde reductase